MAQPLPLPSLLYGTAWKEDLTESLTALALSTGFRAIDTANQRKHYVEAAVGRAVRSVVASGQLRRDELFLQTKFTFRAGQDQRLPYDPRAPVSTQVQQSFQSSLDHFETDYLDSFILHGPSSGGGLAAVDVEAWRAMESLALAGRVHHLGVSNFGLGQLRELLQLAQVGPRFVQNRCYAKTGWDRAVRLLCADSGMTYQAFSLLTANRVELDQPAIKKLSARSGLSVPELVFVFARQRGMLPLTGTSSQLHMRQDLASLSQSLPTADLDLLEHVAAAAAPS